MADATNAAGAHTPRRPDAIRCPRDFPPAANMTARDKARSKIFGPVLDMPFVWNRPLMDRPNESLVVPSNDVNTTSMLFPVGHPWEKQDRYEWWLAEWQGSADNRQLVPFAPEGSMAARDGQIYVGYLKDDPHTKTPETQAAMQAAYDKAYQEATQRPEYLDRLRKLGVVPPDADAVPHPAAPAPAAPAPTVPAAPAGATAPAAATIQGEAPSQAAAAATNPPVPSTNEPAAPAAEGKP